MTSANRVGILACENVRSLTGLWVIMLTLTWVGTFVWAGEGDGTGTRSIPNAGVKTLRPAAVSPSQDDALQRQTPPLPRPADLHPPTNAEMEQSCLKNPRCGQKLDQARQGRRPPAPLPSATAPSQEDKILRSGPVLPGQPLPLPGPRSHVPSFVERFFAWSNPFGVDLAWAQTPFSVVYTTDNRWNQAVPTAGLMLEGGYLSATASFYWLYNAFSTNQPNAENKPYVYLYASLPSAGYYLIDIVSSPSLTKFRHSSGAILETWDDRAGCGGTTGAMSWCHHVTVDYYTAGSHFWYFWSDPTVLYTYFLSATLKSYP